MNERPRADIIDRVKKILARTEERGCTQAEAEAAYKMASRIMAEHALSMDEIEQRGGDAEAWGEDTAGEFSRMGVENNCAGDICRRFFFVESYRMRTWVNGKAKTRQVFFGKPTQVETAKWVYTSLLAAFDRLWGEYRAATQAPRSDRRIFITGAWSGFSGKLEDERRAAEVERTVGSPSGTGTSLAVIDHKVRAAFVAKHPKLGTARAGAPLKGSTSAFSAGIAAGRNLNLARPVEATTRKKLAAQ